MAIPSTGYDEQQQNRAEDRGDDEGVMGIAFHGTWLRLGED
jgi:hypothetical protein